MFIEDGLPPIQASFRDLEYVADVLSRPSFFPEFQYKVFDILAYTVVAHW